MFEIKLSSNQIFRYENEKILKEFFKLLIISVGEKVVDGNQKNFTNIMSLNKF